MYRAIIFDLDGTLVNSLEDLADATNYGLGIMGIKSHPVEAFKTFVGDGTIKLCERALADITDDSSEVSRLHTMFSDYYNAHCMDKTKPYQGIMELLNKLKQQNIIIAVASNKPDEFSKHIVKKIFGENIFSVIMGKSPLRDTKPAPDIIFEILKNLGVSRNEAIMAGDSNVDILTAKNAGIASIGCTWGFRTRQELIDAGAANIADKPEDILKFL